jgi:hypothetical protein
VSTNLKTKIESFSIKTKILGGNTLGGKRILNTNAFVLLLQIFKIRKTNFIKIFWSDLQFLVL